MRVWVPTKGRPEGFSRLTALCGLPVQPVVATDMEAAVYRAHWRKGTVIAHGRSSPAGKGKATTINWVLDNSPEGEWVVFADDDIKSFSGVPLGAEDDAEELAAAAKANPKDREARLAWTATVKSPLTHDQVMARILAAISEAIRVDAWIVGFSPTVNPFFRHRRWAYWTSVPGWLWAVRQRPDMRLTGNVLDDTEFTAMHLERDGCVVVDRWTHVDADWYQGGGHGTIDERRALRDQACREMQARWPHLFPEVAIDSVSGLPYPRLVRKVVSR